MRIAVFGGTGKAGGAVLRHALAEGHEVHALVRAPAALELRHPSLIVVDGNVYDPAAVRRTLDGCEAVVTAIGITSRTRPTLLVDSVTAISAGMRQAGVARLVIVQGVHLPFSGDPHNPGLLLLKTILGVTMRPLVLDGRGLTDLLAHDDREWTVVRMPLLKPGGPTAAAVHGRLRVGPWSSVTTGDVAEFALRCATSHDFAREAPMIASAHALPAPLGSPIGREAVTAASAGPRNPR